MNKTIPSLLIATIASAAFLQGQELVVNGDMEGANTATGGNHLLFGDLDKGWGGKGTGTQIVDDGSTTNNVRQWTGTTTTLLTDATASIFSVSGIAASQTSLEFSFDWLAAGATHLDVTYQVVGWTNGVGAVAADQEVFRNINGSTKTVRDFAVGGAVTTQYDAYDLLPATPVDTLTPTSPALTGTLNTVVNSGTINLDLNGFLVNDFQYIGIRFHIDGDHTVTDATGSYIDNVSLVAVPEPGTFALLSGLCALSFVMVRRRK